MAGLWNGVWTGHNVFHLASEVSVETYIYDQLGTWEGHTCQAGRMSGLESELPAPRVMSLDRSGHKAV